MSERDPGSGRRAAAEDPLLRLLVLRHGETDLNREQRMQGVSGRPMNDLGRRQIAAALPRLTGEGIAAVYASHLLRAQETAATVAGALGVPVHTDPRLSEQDLGTWEGEVWPDLPRIFGEEAVRRYQTDPDFAPPGGESRRALLARLLAALGEIAERERGRTALVVGHGGTILVFMYHVLGIPFTTLNRFYSSNGGLSTFTLRPDGWHLAAYNETFIR